MSIESVEFSEVVKFYSDARQAYVAVGAHDMASECDLAIARAQYIMLDPRILPYQTAKSGK
jgi:hypothetical protein